MSHQFYAFNRETKQAWKFSCSTAWLRKYDNYCAVSIGFSVPDEITERQLKALRAVSVSYDEWNHSGCQSSCVRRGGKECRW